MFQSALYPLRDLLLFVLHLLLEKNRAFVAITCHKEPLDLHPPLSVPVYLPVFKEQPWTFPHALKTF